jgi:hypothetical protein
MPRPRRQDRATITGGTLTLRLTQNDRDVLDCLVEHQAKIVAEQGIAMEPTLAAYLRGLIRREAQRLGIQARRDEAGHAVCERKSA